MSDKPCDTNALPLGLDRNASVRATQLEVPLEAVEATSVLAGEPSQGVLELGHIGGGAEGNATEVGIWELTAGTVTDTEIDEIFVVIAGSAEIELLEVPGYPAETGRVIKVAAGDVMRLVAGTRAKWTVVEKIRKIYIAG